MSTRYQKLMSTIEQGAAVLIDGATGTEVDRRGVPKLANAWNGGGNLSDPGVVCEIHQDYIRAGARIVISNTFATHRHALEGAGVGEDFVAYNRRAMELACEARVRLEADDVLVAGGMSHWDFIEPKPSIAKLRTDAGEQAAIMAEAGAELLMLEMMVEISRMKTLLAAGLETGLPVWPGLSCKLDDDGNVILLHGESLADAVAAICEHDVALINIMHTDVNVVDQCLDVLDACWDGLVGVHAHSGSQPRQDWEFDTVISPDDYAQYVKGWLDRGVCVIGGCCGVGPAHIERLSSIEALRPS